MERSHTHCSKTLVLAAFLVLALSCPAWATTELDFGVISPTTGSISYAGGGAALVGSGISVDNVSGLPGGPTLDCFGCLLNFTTGALTGTTATTWSFGGGAATTITLSGAIDANNDHVLDAGDIGTTLLLSGKFGTATVTSFNSVFKIAGSQFFDTKNKDLTDLFGLPTGGYNGNFNISFNAKGTPPSSFRSSTVLSGDIINEPVPEPGSIILLGSALLGAALVARRRLSD